MTRVKICGLTRPEDIRDAVEAGAHALGFVFEPSSPRYIGDRWDSLLTTIPVYITIVGVFGEPPAICPKGVHAVQALWTSTPDLPSHVRAIQTIRLKATTDVEQAMRDRVEADAYLLDSFDPQQYGGTGKVVDWEVAREFVVNCPQPVILAGGLRPSNVKVAIEKVRPFAVDVSSGVEISPGVKDRQLIEEFVEKVGL